MPEQIEHNRAGQKSCVHENAFAERNIVGHHMRLTENQGCAFHSIRLTRERDLQMRNAKVRFVDDESRRSGSVIGKSNLPRTLARAPMFDARVKNNIHQHRDAEGNREVP